MTYKVTSIVYCMLYTKFKYTIQYTLDTLSFISSTVSGQMLLLLVARGAGQQQAVVHMIGACCLASIVVAHGMRK